MMLPAAFLLSNDLWDRHHTILFPIRGFFDREIQGRDTNPPFFRGYYTIGTRMLYPMSGKIRIIR